jgi:UPF0755 protein
MNDILPPNRQRSQSTRPVNIDRVESPHQPNQELLQPIVTPEPSVAAPLSLPPKKSMSVRKRILLIIGSLFVIALLTIAAAFFWYQQETSPVSSDINATRVRVTIESGTTPDEIGSLLAEKKVIRNTTAFEIYTRLSGTRNKLQAGTFSLSPHESTAAIVDHLVAGKTDQFSITFLPGATVADNKKVLLAAGYSQAEVDAAFKKTYESPLFQDKPANADLEGYIYGETYTFSAGSTVEQILQRTFDEFYAAISKNNLIEGLQSKGFNLYQGITLASIIQREVSGQADSAQVAQIFLKRLNEDMPLGADATFVYAANKAGVTPTVDFDSPYNTRIHTGLPPGPISAPGVAALQAVAHPAEGDYLYFVSGDDGKNYYSRTIDEHEKNTREYCKINCSLF